MIELAAAVFETILSSTTNFVLQFADRQARAAGTSQHTRSISRQDHAPPPLPRIHCPISKGMSGQNGQTINGKQHRSTPLPPTVLEGLETCSVSAYQRMDRAKMGIVRTKIMNCAQWNCGQWSDPRSRHIIRSTMRRILTVRFRPTRGDASYLVLVNYPLSTNLSGA